MYFFNLNVAFYYFTGKFLKNFIRKITKYSPSPTSILSMLTPKSLLSAYKLSTAGSDFPSCVK